jgi:hypothetical protein
MSLYNLKNLYVITAPTANFTRHMAPFKLISGIPSSNLDHMENSQRRKQKVEKRYG